MSDGAGSPEQQERNRRLFGNMIGWLLSRDRRPGMIGAAVSFKGQTRSGPAQLKRTDGGWEFIAPYQRGEQLHQATKRRNAFVHSITFSSDSSA
jgi:hypothetical protein